MSLDVHGDDEVRAAHARMHELLGGAMEPTIVQAMVPEGVECRIGIHRHQALGDLITLGPGGAVAEQVANEAMQLLPLTDADADRLLDRAQLGELVDAEGAGARPALVDVLRRVAALAEAVPEIVTLRLNPILVVDGAAAITDVRIAVAPHTPDSRPPVRRL